MKKSLWLALGVVCALAIVVTREWLIHEEISSLRSSTLDQIREHISNAQTISKLDELQSSIVVYDRYLEPILLASSRLIWSPSRSNLVTEWRREVHTQINERVASRSLELETQLKSALSVLKTSNAPSLKRLFDIIKESEDHSENMSCSDTVKDEINAIQTASSAKDQELLKTLKTEGAEQLKNLKKAIKSKSPQQVAQFLVSGNYYNSIEKPILNLILQIKQEDLRKNAWGEFRKKIDQTLAERKINIAKATDAKPEITAKTIERVTDPVSQALRLDEYFGSEPTDSPSDSHALTDDELGSPSDSQLR